MLPWATMPDGRICDFAELIPYVAEIDGIDLSEPLEKTRADALRALFAEYVAIQQLLFVVIDGFFDFQRHGFDPLCKPVDKLGNKCAQFSGAFPTFGGLTHCVYRKHLSDAR